MKCKFEHDGTCCNSGTFRFKDGCDPENRNYCALMSRGDVLRASSDRQLARILSLCVAPTEYPGRVWELNEAGFSYRDAWMKWLQEPCE